MASLKYKDHVYYPKRRGLIFTFFTHPGGRSSVKLAAKDKNVIELKSLKFPENM